MADAPSAPTRRPHSTRLQRVAEPRCGYSPGSSPPASPTVRELPYLEEPPELARSFGGSGAGAAVDGRPTAAARVWVAAARPQVPQWRLPRALATVSRSSAARRTTWPPPRWAAAASFAGRENICDPVREEREPGPWGSLSHGVPEELLLSHPRSERVEQESGRVPVFARGEGPPGSRFRHAVPIGREHPRRLHNPVPRRTDWPSRWPPATPPAPPPAT